MIIWKFFCRFSGFPVFPYVSISFIKKWFVQGFEVSVYNVSSNTDCQIKQIIKKPSSIIKPKENEELAVELNCTEEMKLSIT